MAQNVTIAGASYSDVPAVDIPKTGGGTAKFVDSSDADAVADSIIIGNTAYVNGNKLTGTLRNSYVIDETLLVVCGASTQNDIYILSQGTVSDEKLILT